MNTNDIVYYVMHFPTVIFWPTILLTFKFPILLTIHIISITFVVIEAIRLNFTNYREIIINSGPKALLGCLLLWHIFFPIFIYNRWMVQNNKATRGKTTNNIFMYIIGIQIFFVLFRFAMPSWVQNPETRKQYAALTALSVYSKAQSEYYTLYGNNTFCKNFKDLYYNLDDEGQYLNLIPKEIADAYCSQDEVIIPFNQYIFLDDPYITQKDLWSSKFGLFAVPLEKNLSMFWIGNGNKKYMKINKKDSPCSNIHPKDSPLYIDEGWVPLF